MSLSSLGTKLLEWIADDDQATEAARRFNAVRIRDWPATVLTLMVSDGLAGKQIVVFVRSFLLIARVVSFRTACLCDGLRNEEDNEERRKKKKKRNALTRKAEGDSAATDLHERDINSESEINRCSTTTSARNLHKPLCATEWYVARAFLTDLFFRIIYYGRTFSVMSIHSCR